MKKKYDSFIQIDNCLISGDVITEYFACDYQKCKGCCCIIGDAGAPLQESEVPQIERNYSNYKELMSIEGREIVESKGFFDIDKDGDIVTPLCKAEECAFTQIMADGFCFCAIERQYFQGKGDFRKPMSCWLYPIRITRLSNGMDALNLHIWNICKDAFIKGKNDKIRVYEFLKEPLVQLYGKEFYEKLSVAAEMLLNNN